MRHAHHQAKLSLSVTYQNLHMLATQKYEQSCIAYQNSTLKLRKYLTVAVVF